MSSLSAVSVTILFWIACSTVASQGFKPGQCPDDYETTYNSTETNCPEESCTIDQDCAGEHLCCSNGCSNQCVNPTEIDHWSVSVSACEGTSVTLQCDDNRHILITSAHWGRGDTMTCPDDVGGDDARCSVRQVQGLLAGLCDGHVTCPVHVSVAYFGEPCASATRKYLTAEYRCLQTVYRAEVCEGSGLLPISCPPGKFILTESAFYGRHEDSTACTRGNTTQGLNCSTDNAAQIFAEACDGRVGCVLDARTETYGDPCPDVSKYLHVSYRCADCTNEHGDDNECDLWTLRGDCASNVDWMMSNCRKSCLNCEHTPPVCENVHNDTECEQWTRSGFCYTDAAWMHVYCRKSCTGCHAPSDCSVNKWDAVNGLQDCDRWFEDAECSNNLQYMFSQCTKACFSCQTDGVIRCSNRMSDELCQEWTEIGECERNPGFMLPNCFKSCIGCTQDPRCENTEADSACDEWADQQQCSENPVFMHQDCWKSCMKCDGPPDCTNLHGSDIECEYWVKQGECQNNPSFVLPNCGKSCTRCGDVPPATTECVNEGANDTQCAEWAAQGQCYLNPSWMIPHCRKTCTACGQSQPVLDQVGGDPKPGGVSDLTRSLTCVLPGTFPRAGWLSHFLVFFVSMEPVELQVWRPAANGAYTEIYSQLVIPTGSNYAQMILAEECVEVQEGDQIGFTPQLGQVSPISQTHSSQLAVTTAFRHTASAAGQFFRMIYPFRFSLSAVIADDVTNTACDSQL